LKQQRSKKVIGMDFDHSCLECGIATANAKFCSHNCHMKNLNKTNVNLRFSGRTKNHFELTQNVKEFIDGLLLGDADLQGGNTCNWATRLRQRFALRYIEWALILQHKFRDFGIDSTLTQGKTYDKRTNKTYLWISLQTKRYPEFKIFRQRWYQENKEIPKDISISKILIENFFLSDGSARNTSQNGAALKLATHAFSEESVNFLRIKMKDFGFNFHIGSENTLHLYSKSDVLRFQKLINFPKCFQYKKVI
jgi:hypothetical protein